MVIVTGLDALLRDSSRLRGRRVGLIANHTSVTRDLDYSWRALPAAGAALRRIFSPEHGLYGAAQDQIPVADQPGAPVEVVSLYGDSFESLSPRFEHLDDLDVVLFDIQDVGARYYTFVNTMALFMSALDGRGIEFVVLDRPNPLGGERVEGPMLEEGYESFVGVLPVPVRHGLTAGELALLWRDARGLDIPLTVVRMEGWRRNMLFQDTGLPWVPPSPNMPTERTAAVYPGLCLLEGTNASEGRGTTTPFEIFGADYVDADELAGALNELALPGARFRPMYFLPTFHKFAGRTIAGAYLHVTDPAAFEPFRAGVAVVKTLHDLRSEAFAFREEVYEFETEHPAFDLLCGSSSIRTMIEAGADLDAIAETWRAPQERFAAEKSAYHLYAS